MTSGSSEYAGVQNPLDKGKQSVKKVFHIKLSNFFPFNDQHLKNWKHKKKKRKEKRKKEKKN